MADLDDSHSKNAKKLKNEDVDKVLHFWFLQQRAVGTPIPGLLLQTKVKIFYLQFHPDDNKFKGYLQIRNRRGTGLV